MSSEFSYLSSDGHTIFTSSYLKKRGSCCRSACLHCPYGHTVKKLGIQFESMVFSDSKCLEEMLEHSGATDFDWKSFKMEDIKFIKIKNVMSGVLFKNHIIIKHLFLTKHFRDQGLSKELVEAYLFEPFQK